MAKIYYHGTSAEAAQAIEREGFKLPKNPAVSGPGVYLTDDPDVAKSYGPSVVKVAVKGRIASADTSLGAESEARDNAKTVEALRKNGNERYVHEFPTDPQKVLQDRGFKGRTDYDDGAKVVFDPKHVQFIGHHALNPAQFGGN